MKNTLVVVADLGCFKAYKVENNQTTRTPRLELIEQFDNPEAHGRLVDKVSDQSGRFPRGTGGGAMSDGERHNIGLEMRKRFVKQLAQRFNSLARNQEIERCLCAVSKEINRLLVEELEPGVRAKIEKTLPVDLTKLDRTEILKRFELMP
jgi:hypothetical protein